MKRCKRKSKSAWPYALALLIAGAVLMTAPISSWAAHLGTSTLGHASSTDRKAEDVRSTLHNLSTSNPIAGVNIAGTSSSTAEVCVFCHTPHGANTGASGAAPLWNRAMPATSAYTTYSGPNFDGSAVAPVGVSLACLSCHDGTLALDALINMPGSGGFRTLTPTSAGLIGSGSGSGFLGTGNVMSADARGVGTNYETLSGGTPFPNLTQNLSDDHPVSFAMGTGDPQFDDITTGTAAGNVLLIARNAISMVSPIDRRDAIRLYPASGGSTAPTRADGWVECASCHNPHAPRPLFLRLPNYTSNYGVKGGGAVTVGTVLTAQGTANSDARLIADDPNAGSAICLSCHEK